MPKVKIVCLILATVLASVGTLLVLTNLGGGAIPPLDAPTDDINTYLDTPVEGTPADVEDVRENLFIAHKVLLVKDSFYGISEGSTTSFGIEQQVLNTRYVLGEFGNKNSFKQMVTKGVVPNAYQLYMWGDNYLHRSCSKVNALDDVVWKNTATKLEKEDFLNRFGHRSDKLTGYILNYDTVTSGVLEGVADGIYTFRFVLDTTEATSYLRKEMLTNGNLADYPTFSKAEIVVTMDAEWNVQTLTTDCEYTAKTMGINAPCSEDITETFYYDHEGDLPEKDFFEQFFDADYSDINKEKGALDVLLDMFSPYLNGEDLQVALAVNRGDSQLASGLVSISNLDISDLSKLSVSAKVGNALNVAYEHSEGKIYLKYQDFQASTTVDGILGLVDTILPMLGDSVGDFDLGDIDLDSLLENLTYEISEDGASCTVSLPLSIVGLDIDAKLYGKAEGDSFTFVNACVMLGDVEIALVPQSWEVEQRSGAYPEILGLLDLIQNGKISLDAQVALTIDGASFTVDANALIDLATHRIALDANLGKYGSVSAVLADSVAYIKYGDIKLKLKFDDIASLIELVEKYTGVELSTDMPSISASDILALLSTISATGMSDGGVAFNLTVGDISCGVFLASRGDVWQLDSIAVDFGSVSATVVPSDEIGEVEVPADADEYADVMALAETFVDPIVALFNAQSYALALNGKVTLGDSTYTVGATVHIDGSNAYIALTLALGNAKMIDAQLWIVDSVLYFEMGDLRFASKLEQKSNVNTSLTLDDIKQTLTKLQGYNNYLDEIIELALNALDTKLDDIDFEQLVTKLMFVDGKLTLGINGEAFGLTNFQLALSTSSNGVQFALNNLAYRDVAVDLGGSIAPYTGVISAPNGDFTTNLKVIIDENNTLYANIDLFNKVIKLQLVSSGSNGKTTTLDILYSLSDNIIRITNGHNLFVSADINNIANIVNEIDSIVNEFAGGSADSVAGGLSGLGSIDLKAIISTLRLSAKGSKAELSFDALGLHITATFAGGAIESIVLPISDGLTLTVKTEPFGVNYADFPTDDAAYVRIDDVFNDYFYGDGEDQRGAIDTLIHTNSWKFDFVSDSEITVNNDDSTVDRYQIAAGSYFVFYFNKTEASNIKLRAKLTVNKFGLDKWNEFIILDIAYIDGRIFVNYDSNSSNNNVLKATVSVDAIKECLNLLPALYKVVPQIEELINSLGDMMEEASGGLTLGNLASLFNEVTYNDDKVFTLSLNAGIIDGLGEIYLSAQQYGNQGLQLNNLCLGYNNISVNLNNIVVTASQSTVDDEGNKSFDYVDRYIATYLDDNGGQGTFMNFDTIRELLAGFVITADNVDADGNRSFAIEGTVTANVIGLAKVNIQIYINVDIDKDNNVYLAVKIHRDSATGLAGGLAYDDEGGDSYILLDSKQQTISLARNSIQKQTWCSKCGWICSKSVLHLVYHSNKKVSDYEYHGAMSFEKHMTLSEFAADTPTMVGYILELINFSSTIENQITKALGNENTNVYGIEDIFKSYSYSFNAEASQGTFAIGLDLSPIDSALGDVTINILHKGDFDEVYYDDEGNFHDGNGSVALTQIKGKATMISIMDATFELTLTEPTTGLARNYVNSVNFLW